MTTRKRPIKGMRQFERIRTLKELTAICNKKKWPLHTEKFKEGSDFVSFDFVIRGALRTSGVCLYSVFNGWFFGHLSDGTQFDSKSIRHEKELWFSVLLDTCYVVKEAV